MAHVRQLSCAPLRLGLVGAVVRSDCRSDLNHVTHVRYQSMRIECCRNKSYHGAVRAKFIGGGKLQGDARDSILMGKAGWGVQYPPICIEEWKDMFLIAVRAKHRIDIRELLNVREPDYIEPQLQDAEDNETHDQKKKLEKENEKAITQAMKEHDDRVKAWHDLEIGGMPRNEADGQIKSLLYLMLGSEARRQFQSRLPHVRIVDTSLAELWLHLDIVFHRERNISVDRVALISRRQRE